MNILDKIIAEISPFAGLKRIQARSALKVYSERHYDAASQGRRTSGWRRASGDANTINGQALHLLRIHARDLARNNPWAKRATKVICNNTVGWGITPKPVDAGARAKAAASKAWKAWAESTQCDYDGRLNVAGLQRLALSTIVVSGEVLIRRHWQSAKKRMPISLKLQVLEGDFIDSNKNATTSDAGGPIIQGVEFTADGERAAYWLYPKHPGSSLNMGSSILSVSKRTPAKDILHVYDVERAGEVRPVSWFAPITLRIKDLDEYEDATLLKQKIAACFAVFVTDMDGSATPVGAVDAKTGAEQLEPGMIEHIAPGKDVKFADPPSVAEFDPLTKAKLRSIAMGMGVTYEDLTGDYSQSNFSSARMSRLAHWANVHHWRWNMLVPQLCNPMWAWAMEALVVAGAIGETPAAQWTAPPMPMIEPDKEGLAYTRLVRAGSMTHDAMVREQGSDPDTHWDEYAAGLKMLDSKGIILDSDARMTTQAGNPRHQSGQASEDGQQDGAADDGTEEKK